MMLIVFFIIFVCYTILDVYKFITKGGEATFCWQFYLASKSQPILPFTLGILIGHILWVQHGA